MNRRNIANTSSTTSETEEIKWHGLLDLCKNMDHEAVKTPEGIRPLLSFIPKADLGKGWLMAFLDKNCFDYGLSWASHHDSNLFNIYPLSDPSERKEETSRIVHLGIKQS